jgi:uncharacterized protein YpmS
MKWFKRFLIFIGLVLATVLVTVGVAIYKVHSTPRWYRQRVMSDQQISDAANSAKQKLARLVDWAANIQAQQTRQRRGIATSESPIGPQTITLADEEINALAKTWYGPNQTQARQKLSKYFTDGRLFVVDGKLILVGNSKDFGTLTSASFTPAIDDKGQLWLKLDGFSAGTLPIPQSMVSGKLKQLQLALESLVSEYQDVADIDKTGVANSPAAKSEMTTLLLNTLKDQPSDPVLFIPFDVNDHKRSLPVQVTAVKADQGTLTLTLAPMAPADQIALLNKIKHPPEPQADADQ